MKAKLFKGGIIICPIVFLLILAAVYLPWNYGREASSFPIVIQDSRKPISMRQTTLHHQPKLVPSTYNNKVAVLEYHDINPDGHNTITVTPQRLDADLTLLEQRGFHIIPISQMAAFMEHGAAVPEKAVVMTFDDGYQGVYQYAFPILKKHNAPATIFIIGYYVGRLPGYLTWPEVRQLEESGLVTAGGHTYNQHRPEQTTMPNLSGPATINHIFNSQTNHEETDQEYEARMLADSQLFQETLKGELGHTTPYFAYPYGAYNAAMIKILHNTGFRYMFTVLPGINTRNGDPTRLFRINAGATWISTKNLPSRILRAALSSFANKQPSVWLPAWKV